MNCHHRGNCRSTSPASSTAEFAGAQEAARWFERERPNVLAALRLAVDLGQYDIAWKLPVVADGFFELGSYWSDWEDVHRLGLLAAQHLGDALGEASNVFCCLPW